MTDFDKLIETELLKRVSEKTRINLMTETNSIMSVGRLSCLCHSSLAVFIQKSFLQCNLNFKYELAPSRNGAKIIGLSKSLGIYDDEIIKKCNFIDENTAIFLYNQFDTINILNIAKIYDNLVSLYDLSCFIELDDSIVDKIYKNDPDMSLSEVKEAVAEIKQYGYCIYKNNVPYWKMYTPEINVSSEDMQSFFTIIARKEIEEDIEKEVDIIEIEKVVQKDFTTLDAINLIAKELGLTSIEKTQSKLEETLAITNELINNLDSMQDWEKLMNWDKFVTDWKTLMGDALNDRN